MPTGSAVFPFRDKELAVEAVCCEPLSPQNSLPAGKSTGDRRRIRVQPVKSQPYPLLISHKHAQLPALSLQGFVMSEQGNPKADCRCLPVGEPGPD